VLDKKYIPRKYACSTTRATHNKARTGKKLGLYGRIPFFHEKIGISNEKKTKLGKKKYAPKVPSASHHQKRGCRN